MYKINFVSILFMALLSFIGCKKETESNPKLYNFPLAQENMIDENKLSYAYERAGEIENLRSLLVSKNNILISEVYFKDGAKDELHDVMSVTKSFTSTLVGIAMDKGYIISLDQTLGDFFDSTIYDLSDEKSSISLYNLMRMSCGIPWKELGLESEFIDWYYNSDDHINYILDKEMIYTPRALFNYSDGAAHLVSVVLTEAVGMSTFEFANKYLFKPLQIDSCKWTKDNRGYNLGGVRLKITPLSMLKFGELILNEGKYGDVQIISKTWIDKATTSHIETNDCISFQNGYGLFWWTGQKNGYDYFFANGFGGQFIVIVPELKMVVVSSNNISGITVEKCNEQWCQTIDIIINYLIPSTKRI